MMPPFIFIMHDHDEYKREDRTGCSSCLVAVEEEERDPSLSRRHLLYGRYRVYVYELRLLDGDQ